jgi:carotenoid cleavage dioxygenase-like enzyme
MPTRKTLVGDHLELPRINYRRANTRPHRFVYGAGFEERDWFDRIVKADVQERTTRTWHEQGCHPGEPVFVADPSEEAEDQGVLLSVVLDARRGNSFVLVLDATDLSELARAEVPHHIPYSFHGNYFESL